MPKLVTWDYNELYTGLNYQKLSDYINLRTLLTGRLASAPINDVQSDQNANIRRNLYILRTPPPRNIGPGIGTTGAE